MNTGDEMAQTMKIMYQGTEFLLRMSGTLIKETAMLIAALLHKQSEKPSVGKTNLLKMLKDGDTIKVLRFDERDLTAFCKLSKDFGFPVVPVKNRTGNELCHVLVREKDAELVNAALTELGFAKMRLQEHEKNAQGTPPLHYSTEPKSSSDRNKSETPRIGESAIPLLQTGDAQYGDFVPAYCYPPEVVHAEPPRPIPLLGDGLAHNAPPKDRKPDIILSPAEYMISDAALLKRQETEPLVFLQDPKTGVFEMLSPDKAAKWERPARSKNRKPSVKKALAKHAAQLKVQSKEIPAIRKAKER